MPSAFSLGSSSAEEPLSLASLITGSNCLKTCGMEDIQYAARRAAELFITLRFCAIALSIVTVLYILLLIGLKLTQLEVFQMRWTPSRIFGHSTEDIRGIMGRATKTRGSCQATKENEIKETLAELSAKMSIQSAALKGQQNLSAVEEKRGCQDQSLAFAKPPTNLSFFGTNPNPPSLPHHFPTSLSEYLTTSAKRMGESPLATAGKGGDSSNTAVNL